MGKYIRLAIAILIPLLVATIIGVYGFGRYKTGDFINSFSDNYITQGETTVERLDLFTEYVSYKYKEEKFTAEVESSLGKIFDLDIWAVLEEDKTNITFTFYLYNINYGRLNQLRGLSSTEIAEETFLRIRMMVIPEEGAAVVPEAMTIFVLDYNAIPDKNNKEVPVTAKKMTFKTNSFSPDSYLKFYYDDPTAMLEYRADTKTFKPGINHADYAVVEMGDFFNQSRTTIQVIDGCNNDVMNAGYTAWIIKTKLWWQALVGFAVVLGVTLSFHLVWEYDNKKETEKKRKKPINKK